jgi:hypothetical protein
MPMFCNYCGAPNPDAALFCSKCGKQIAATPPGTPVPVQPSNPQPIAVPVTPAIPVPPREAPSAVGPVGRENSAPVLTPAARTEFTDGLTVEVRHQIEEKSIPGAIIAFIATLIAIARFSMIGAFVSAVVVAGIALKILNGILEDKYLRPIAGLSDEMLVTRYNEAKADRRAARTRTAISWAVIAIVAVLLVIAWLALRSQ